MDSEEFWKRVSVRSEIHGRDHVVAAAACVFEALRARISHDTGEHLAAQLPTDVKKLWESRPALGAGREGVGFERVDLDEFLGRVQSDSGLTGPGNAADLARAVFMTLQEQVTPGAADKIASELPEDIRVFWVDSTPEERPIESPTSRAPRPSEAREAHEKPALAREYPEGEGPELPPASERTPAGHVEGEYTSQTIGPSAASVHRSDDQIKAEIEGLLEASDEVDASRIDVEVRAGQVTLRGAVKNNSEREAAKHVAHEALGTVRVRDELRMGEGG